MNKKFKRLVSAAILFFGVLSPLCYGDTQGQSRENMAARRYLLAYESMEMGDWLTRQEMDEAAVDMYREALGRFQALAKEYPLWQSDLIEYRIAYCVNQLENIEITDTVADAKPADAELIYKALRLERMPDLSGALDVYMAILKEQPSNLQALKGAVRCYLRMNSIQAARDLLSEGITEPVTDSDLLLLMALIKCHYRQFDMAIQLLRKSLENNRMNAEAHVAMGVALAGQGRFESAENEMKRALGINSRISEAYYNLAWIRLRLDPGNTDVVRLHYNNSLRYGGDPDPLLQRLFQ